MIYVTMYRVKDLRRDEDDDQADVLNIIQKKTNTVNGSIHLKVEWRKQWRVAQGREKQVCLIIHLHNKQGIPLLSLRPTANANAL